MYMKRIKYIKSFLLSLFTLFSLSPIFINTSCKVQKLDGDSYKINDVKKHDGSDWYGVLEGKFNDKQYKIDENNKTITYIGCTDLIAVNLIIPNNVKYKENIYAVFLGDNCFNLATKIRGNLMLNSNISYIPTRCFYFCYIDSIYLNSYLYQINDFAFYECLGLNYIYVNSSVLNNNWLAYVSYLGDYAFYNCILQDMTLVFSPNIQYLGSHCFENCFGIYDVYFHEVCEIEELLDRTFYNCSSLRYLHLSSNIKKIHDECFALCSRITNIQFDNPIHDLIILSKAFWDCDNLQGFTNNCNFSIIGEQAFYQCSKLSFPVTCFYNTTGFQAYSFYKCIRLFKLKFYPNSKQQNQVVYSKTFVDCSNIDIIDFSEYDNVPSWFDTDIYGRTQPSTNVFASSGREVAKYSQKGTIYIPGDLNDVDYHKWLLFLERIGLDVINWKIVQQIN